MKIVGSGQLIFVGNAGIGQGQGTLAPPQILAFDVYYTDPPIVGFHIVKPPEETDET